ncbi:hypothetical protein [Stenotrophomonas sp. MMGLT7]|uniref:hypothetical protein n=1 Tax=Stenotrophomonas sp. MMGLT7 TaxID=2901227 RepID=UPI001E443743|nr:hypothetical protein [Stenotrophomonas sp. MMGLT7]MCD7096970.1 hypothetical protein [Stenotrophomonas sp. MMGLT7]
MGSKKKRNKNKKKERIEYIQWTTRGEVTSIEVSFDPATGKVTSPQADKHTMRSEISYERDSGKNKVLASVPAINGASVFDAWEQLVSQATHIIAVDTNSRDVNGRKISVTFACRTAKMLPPAPEYSVAFVPLCCYVIFDVTDGVNPERIGWHLTLKNHINIEKLGDGQSLGIIVDSELGKLQDLNKRAAGYYQDILLPEKSFMTYASDAAMENPASVMIKYCHDSANKVFDRMINDFMNIEIPNNGNSDYRGHVRVKINVMPPSRNR